MSCELKQIIEALLFAAEEPLPGRKIAEIVGNKIDGTDVRKAVDALRDEFTQADRPYTIEEIAGGYQLLTQQAYGVYIRRLFKTRSKGRLSQAALETLSIIAYRQPVLKADIEIVRGVNVDQMIQSLMEKELIKVTGRAESLGRPILYGTTPKFLKVFGLRSLKDLPNDSEITPATDPSVSLYVEETEETPQAEDNTQAEDASSNIQAEDTVQAEDTTQVETTEVQPDKQTQTQADPPIS